MSNKPSIVLVGCGLIGKKHLNILRNKKDIVLHGVVVGENDFNNPCDYLKDLNIFKSIYDIHNLNDIHGAIIASPTNYHFEQSLFFLNKKIPILIEKPITSYSEEGLVLIRKEAELGVKILVGHHRHHNNIVKSLLKFIESHNFGKLKAFSGACAFYKPLQYFLSKEWRTMPGHGGVGKINLIHEIGLIRSICGEISHVFSYISDSSRKLGVEETIVCSLRLQNGILGNLLISDSLSSAQSWEINSRENDDFPFAEGDYLTLFFENGTVSVPSLTYHINNSNLENSWLNKLSKGQIIFKKNDPLEEQIQHFVSVIKGKEIPLVTATDGVMNLRVVECILKSGAIGKEIEIVL